MTDSAIIVDLVLIVAAAVAGGTVATWLKQPTIVGYIIGGVAVGPFTPGPEADINRIGFLTEIGVAFLLFVMGTQISFASFRKVGGVVFLGGLAQVALTILLGLGLAPLLDMDFGHGLFLGVVLAQSSTAVIAKVMSDRGETQSIHSKIATGISVVQDLTSIPLLVVLLVVLGAEGGSVGEASIAFGKALGILTATYIIGKQLWPWILNKVAALQSPELLLVTTVALALGGALAVQEFGLSFAVGGFLAGLVVAESKHRAQAVTGILPLRDIFAVFFFASVGMLLDPKFIWEHPLPLFATIGAVLVGKTAISAFLIKAFRYPGAVALLTGLALAQIGEFAFILARTGANQGVIDDFLFNLIIASAVVTILINSLLLDSTPPILAKIAEVSHFHALVARRPQRARFMLRPRRFARSAAKGADAVSAALGVPNKSDLRDPSLEGPSIGRGLGQKEEA
ncbi:MAG: cation:proton antiporter [Chloroflexi bacterium]|nr:cation:proton antiporter [Chloroflexota bacterium]